MERYRHIKETTSVDSDSNNDALEMVPSAHKIEYPPHSQETEQTPDQKNIREILTAIDESALKEIFAEYIRKSDRKEETMNWIPLENIRIELPDTKRKNTHGIFSPGTGITLFAHADIEKEDVLWATIHEELHAVTNAMVLYPDQQQQGIEHLHFQSGISTVDMQLKDDTMVDKTTDFVKLNEGLTEYITAQIFSTYLEAYGYGPNEFDRRKSENALDRVHTIDAYAPYYDGVQTYMQLIAAVTDMPIKTVEQGIMRAYFRGGTVVPYEAISLFGDYTTEELWKVLSTDADKSELLALIENLYHNSHLTREQYLRILDALLEQSEKRNNSYDRLAG